MFKHILAPTDGSELSLRAVRVAADLARASGARLTLFHALPEPPLPVTGFGEDAQYDPDKPKRFSAAAQAQGQAFLDAAVEAARSAGIDAQAVFAAGDAPYQAIIRTADEQECDVIVMASHGRRGLDALLLGSETHKVLTHCKVPVLVCR